jgi:hypothetical protein
MFKKDTFMKAGTLVAGGVVASIVTNKLTMIADTRLRSAVPVVLGIILAGNKNKMISGLGDGMVAVGGTKLVASLLPNMGISAIDADEVVEGVYIDQNPINATSSMQNMDVINGYDEDYTDAD